MGTRNGATTNIVAGSFANSGLSCPARKSLESLGISGVLQDCARSGWNKLWVTSKKRWFLRHLGPNQWMHVSRAHGSGEIKFSKLGGSVLRISHKFLGSIEAAGGTGGEKRDWNQTGPTLQRRIRHLSGNLEQSLVLAKSRCKLQPQRQTAATLGKGN